MKDAKKISIQETYGERFQHCWGCGPKNDKGLHLKSFPSEDKKTVRAKIIPNEMYTGGVPQNLFGGMIAMIFDCHGTASASYFAHINKGLEFDENTLIGRFITARLEVDFKKPTPMNEEIEVIAKLEEISERKAIINMELLAKGEIRAKAKMVAVKVKDNM